MQDYTQFRQNLNNLKKQEGWNNETLGRYFGVTSQVISNWLTGRTPEIPLPPIRKFCAVTGINYDWLMGDEKAPKYKWGNEEPITLKYNIEAEKPLVAEESPFRRGQAGRTVPTNSMVRLRTQIAAIVDELGEGVFEIFEVEGASMNNSLSQGDKLICKMTSVDEIVDGRIHVLVVDRPEMTQYRSSRIWIKRCDHRKANGHVTCRSDMRSSPTVP
jgi:transcriptional regulator with XRE-family HTH domain